MESGWINQVLGTDIHTLLYIKQITSKDLLYSTGNCTQCLVTSYTEKNLEKDICVCITESPCCKSTVLQFKKRLLHQRRKAELNATETKARGFTCSGEVLGEASGETATVTAQLFLLTVFGSQAPDLPQSLGDWVPVFLADDISSGMAPISGL